MALAADDTSIQFSPPPFPMTNLIVNDAVQGTGLDYMNLSGMGFNLHCANIGQGSIDRYWDKGGVAAMLTEQIIFGTFDMGDMGLKDATPFTMFGFGMYVPVNFYFDPISKEADDNSFPLFFGPHVSLTEMFGTMSYKYNWHDYDIRHSIWIPIPGYWYRWYEPHYTEVTDTATMMMLGINVGWQAGLQYGLNLGDYIKFLPYVSLSQEVVAWSMMDMFATYNDDMDSSSSTNMGPLPVSFAPGFDIIMRKFGLSLGAAFQTTKTDSGDMKQINVHLRWSEKFRSICGL